MPELRLVVLALQDRLAYGPDVRGGDGRPLRRRRRRPCPPRPRRRRSRRRGARPPRGRTSGTPEAPADTNALIAGAAQDLSDYQRLTAEGKLGEAGRKLEALKAKLERAQQDSAIGSRAQGRVLR